MARLTGTEILSLARIHAQDNDANSNFAVGASDALVLLNAVLAEWGRHFSATPRYVGASVSGLTFAAGDSTKTTDGDATFFEDVKSFHQSNAAVISFPLSPGIERVSVDVILGLLDHDGDNALSQDASDWRYVALERTQDASAANADDQVWRVWVYPVLNRARHMHLKTIPVNTISAIGEYPDVTEGEGRDIARLLAWEIARLKKESTQAFLDSIVAPLPGPVKDRFFKGGVASGQRQSQPIWRDWA